MPTATYLQENNKTILLEEKEELHCHKHRFSLMLVQESCLINHYKNWINPVKLSIRNRRGCACYQSMSSKAYLAEDRTNYYLTEANYQADFDRVPKEKFLYELSKKRQEKHFRIEQ